MDEKSSPHKKEPTYIHLSRDDAPVVIESKSTEDPFRNVLEVPDEPAETPPETRDGVGDKSKDQK